MTQNNDKIFIADYPNKKLVSNWNELRYYPAIWLAPEMDGKEMIEGVDFRICKAYVPTTFATRNRTEGVYDYYTEPISKVNTDKPIDSMIVNRAVYATPHPDKPFIVANVRDVLDLYDKEEISFSRMVEIMNEMVFQWQQSQQGNEAVELENMTKEKDYWYNRCFCAENFITESPCDPDIKPKQIDAYNIWQQSKVI